MTKKPYKTGDQHSSTTARYKSESLGRESWWRICIICCADTRRHLALWFWPAGPDRYGKT